MLEGVKQRCGKVSPPASALQLRLMPKTPQEATTLVLAQIFYAGGLQEVGLWNEYQCQ